MESFRLLLEHLAWIEHQFLRGIRDSRKAGSPWGMMRGVGGVRKSIHQSWLAKGLGLGLLCWNFKGVRENIPSEEASTLQIITKHQSTTPSLSQTIWPRWASRQFLSLPTVQTLLPVTFGYSLSSEAVVMRQLRRWKRLWRRSPTRSHKRTSMGPSRSCWNGTTSALQLKEIPSKGTRVSCVSYQWKCPYEKSVETYLMILVYIYIYIHMYVSQVFINNMLHLFLSVCLYVPQLINRFLFLIPFISIYLSISHQVALIAWSSLTLSLSLSLSLSLGYLLIIHPSW